MYILHYYLDDTYICDVINTYTYIYMYVLHHTYMYYLNNSVK